MRVTSRFKTLTGEEHASQGEAGRGQNTAANVFLTKVGFLSAGCARPAIVQSCTWRAPSKLPIRGSRFKGAASGQFAENAECVG